MDIANDNEEGTAATSPAFDAVLPSGIRELLDQCDQAGVGMDVVMNLFRVRLYELGFDKTARTEKILTALRNVIERYR